MSQLPPKITSALIFLSPEAHLAQKYHALNLHLQSYYTYCALTAATSPHSSTLTLNGILCTSEHCVISSEEAIRSDVVLDRVLSWYRETSVEGGDGGAIMWFLGGGSEEGGGRELEIERELDARFYARGVSPNWEAQWMSCELKNLTVIDDGKEPQKRDFEVVVELVPGERVNGVWKVKAMRGNKWLGGCILHVTTGEYGIGGLFDMYVKPEERRKGIGIRLTRSACEFAREMGCWHVMLNATDEGAELYSRVGFRDMGKGRTWFLKKSVLALPPPSSIQVRFLEAVGKGDLDVLDRMMADGELLRDHLGKETVNGETPLEIATRCRQQAAAERLVKQGVVPDVMSLWDLGWEERIPGAIFARPKLLERKGGRWMATPLHYAVERGDLGMVRLLLSGSEDLGIRDGVFGATVREWGSRFGNTEIIELLELAGKS